MAADETEEFSGQNGVGNPIIRERRSVYGGSDHLG